MRNDGQVTKRFRSYSRESEILRTKISFSWYFARDDNKKEGGGQRLNYREFVTEEFQRFWGENKRRKRRGGGKKGNE